jgi:phage tail-like protein
VGLSGGFGAIKLGAMNAGALTAYLASAPLGTGIGSAFGASDHTAVRFKVYNAWPTSVAYSDLNAGDNALFVEQMTLVHEGFDVNWAPDLKTPAPRFA